MGVYLYELIKLCLIFQVWFLHNSENFSLFLYSFTLSFYIDFFIKGRWKTLQRKVSESMDFWYRFWFSIETDTAWILREIICSLGFHCHCFSC